MESELDDKHDHDAARETVRIRLPEPASYDASESTVFSRTEGNALESQYQWIDKIGGGGMGIVYLARDRRLGRVVAIKRLHAKCLADEGLKTRLFQEARATASLSHIHIVHIYALGEDTDGPYIVMEYIGGPQFEEGQRIAPPYTLADRIHREGPMALDVAIDFVVKLCRAIEYAHENGVIHRDLKPGNVLLDGGQEPKVVDFGLAQVRKHDVEPLTLPGERMLSLGYGAPEQELDASLVDERADVYGLGALLYFCVTGKNPRYFRQNDLPEVIRMPVIKALETDREQRWEGVAAFCSVLVQMRSSGDHAVPTGKVTWRCKWCDTVNPAVIRYCGKCGWDGGVFCPECGSESRFGTQYCGVCGNDAKQYEAALRVLENMRRSMKLKEFVLVAQEEQSIGGFRPQGVNGRQLLEKVHELGEKAREAVRRRSRIRNEIEHGLTLNHYEQVRSLIREYNELSFDRAFDELERKLDDLQLERDMRNLREAVEQGKWAYAKQVLKEIRFEGNCSSELLFLRQNIARHFRFVRFRRHMFRIIMFLLFYVLMAYPLQRAGFNGRFFSVIWAPVRYAERAPGVGEVLKWYAEWVGTAQASDTQKPTGVPD